jgi:hypothetical protein
LATKPLIILARHKYLLLVPFLVILPLAIVFSLATRKTTYGSSSIVWVEPPVFLQAAQQAGYNGYLSPAQNEANTANELLATDSFAEAVAKAVNKSDVPITATMVRNGTSIYANGVYSLTIAHRDKDGRVPPVIVKGVVDELKSEYAVQAQKDAELAKDYYNAQLPSDRAAADSANQALAQYISQHPGAASSGTDPQYLSLQTAAQQAQNQYLTTRQNLARVNDLTGATLEAFANTITVRDDAKQAVIMPVSKRTLLAAPAGGLLLAISLAAAMYTFLLRTDNSIRVAEDLQVLPGLALLGSVPDVSSVKKRGWPKHFFRLAVTALGVTIQR